MEFDISRLDLLGLLSGAKTTWVVLIISLVIRLNAKIFGNALINYIIVKCHKLPPSLYSHLNVKYKFRSDFLTKKCGFCYTFEY